MGILLSIFVTSFIVALSGAMMPGPLLTVTISESAKKGFTAGPLLIAGHAILELTLVIALILGLAQFLKQKEVFIFIALSGSAILLWMAFGMFKSLPSLTLEQEAKGGSKKGNLIVSGILMSIANPYWSIWWATIGLGYIIHSMNVGKWGIFAFFTGHILADLAWYTIISVGIWKGKSFFSDRAYRYIIGACALFLVVFSGVFAYSGILRIIA